ncbi:MAG TPA: RNA methyltransferase, partial [Candidatus Elarobacter sp.]|nr:RNA methyltransferase [Candidatus Elarobacter sp.]
MKLLSVARDVRRRRARERTGLFSAEGVRTVEELLASPLDVRGALVSATLEATGRGRALRAELERTGAERGFELREVTELELASAADTESPQGVIAVAKQPERTFDQVPWNSASRILLLDGVQDPGNAGTILRTAEAFGVTATIAMGGSVDLWNPKVVRSSMGALFRHHAFSASAAEVVHRLRAERFAIWAGSADGDPLPEISRAPDRLAIVVGNEAGGITGQLADTTNRVVAIPIRGV